MAFPVTSILDNFNRADVGPPLAGNWTPVYGHTGLKIVSNQCNPGTSASDNGEYWNAATFGADCEAYVTAATIDRTSDYSGTKFFIRAVTPSAATIDGYSVEFQWRDALANTDDVIFCELTNNVYTQIGATLDSTGWSNAHQYDGSMVGTTLTAYRNGTSLDTRTDGTYTAAGYIGFGWWYNNVSIPKYDDFGGGTIGTDGFPSIEAGDSTNGTSLSGGVALNMPSGIVAGELLVAEASNDNTGGTNMGISGWTQLFHTQYTGNVVSHGAWAKIAAGSDTATLTGASQDYAARVWRISNHGVATIASDIKVGTPATGSSSAPNPPSLDAGSSKKWLWLASNGSDDDDNTTPYAPTNYTADAQVESASSTSSTMLQTAWRKYEIQTEDPGAFALAATEEWIANVIAIPPAVAGTNLVVQDATHTHAADAIVLTASNYLAVTEATHIHATDAVALTATVYLAVADATHEHTADAITLVLSAELAVQDATHDHAVDAITLTLVSVLVVQDATHEHASDAISLTANSVLAVTDATHEHAADAIALTASNDLAVTEATHDHAADAITLTLSSTLVVQDAAHEHASDAIGLTANVYLAVTDATHEHAADAIALTASNYLAVTEATHDHAADAITLTTNSYLAVQDATHVHVTDGITLSVDGSDSLVVQDATHEHASDAIGLTANSLLAVTDATHEHAVDAIALTASAYLTVTEATHSHAADAVTLTAYSYLVVTDATHSHTVDAITFVTEVFMGLAALTTSLVDVAEVSDANPWNAALSDTAFVAAVLSDDSIWNAALSDQARESAEVDDQPL